MFSVVIVVVVKSCPFTSALLQSCEEKGVSLVEGRSEWNFLLFLCWWALDVVVALVGVAAA